jgi:hypothetical protein
VVRAAAAVALHGRERGGVEAATGRRSARGKAYAHVADAIGAVTGDVPKAGTVLAERGGRRWARARRRVKRQTHVALLVATVNAEARALCLDVAYAAARVALLGRHGARLRAGSGLVAWLAAVVAQSGLGRAVFCNVPDYSTRDQDGGLTRERHDARFPHLKHPFLENWYAILQR